MLKLNALNMDISPNDVSKPDKAKYDMLKYIIKQAEGDYDKYLTKTSEALRVGSLVHDNCEKLLNGEELFIENDKEVQKGVISLLSGITRISLRY